MTDNKFAPVMPSLGVEGGTPPEKLYAHNLTLNHGIGTLITMAKENAPDVKDCPAPEGAYRQALEAHNSRISRLEALQAEYRGACNYIYEAWYSRPLKDREH
jgi:hypothetical protein